MIPVFVSVPVNLDPDNDLEVPKHDYYNYLISGPTKPSFLLKIVFMLIFLTIKLRIFFDLFC